MNQQPLALIAGAGAGLGQSILNRFSKGGFHVVGLVRSQYADKSGFEFHQLDLTNADETSACVQGLIKQYGPPKVVVHNPAELVIRPFSETLLSEFEQTWRSMAFSAAILAQTVLQPMVRGGGGTFVVSGATASLRGSAKFSAFASAKFALRGLTQSLAREYQSANIHVAHVILDGIIDSQRSRELHDMDPGRMMKPEDIAEIYWQIAHQPASTWTHEIDLRPSSESF